MSYGQNAPWGLQAIKTTTGATWNGQTNPYLIPSGYANNIFKGDLVYLTANGTIANLADLGVNLGNNQVIGVFNGCSFQTTTATNPIDPASPGRSYWPAATVTFNAQPAIADIIDDPTVVYNIQSNSVGLSLATIGSTASVAYPAAVGGLTPGNTQTGQSMMVLDTPTVINNALPASALLNLRILRLVPTAGNIGDAGAAVAFNNAEVIIQNHSFVVRPSSQTPHV